MAAHEAAGEPPLFAGLTNTFGEGPQPELQRAKAEEEAGRRQQVLKPIAVEATEIERDRETRDRRDRQARHDQGA